MTPSARNHQLHFVDSGTHFLASEGESVINAVRRANPHHPMLGCRGGGCGICRVRVLAGSYSCGLMSKEYVQDNQRTQGIALACRLYPHSDLELIYLGKQPI